MSGRNERDHHMEAADAARLRDDPALQSMLGDLERNAVDVAINDSDPRTREGARLMALAVHSLRLEISNRIETVLMREHARLRAIASE